MCENGENRIDSLELGDTYADEKRLLRIVRIPACSRATLVSFV